MSRCGNHGNRGRGFLLAVPSEACLASDKTSSKSSGRTRYWALDVREHAAPAASPCLGQHCLACTIGSWTVSVFGTVRRQTNRIVTFMMIHKQ